MNVRPAAALLALSLAGVLALTGCTPPGPAGTASPTPAATAEATPTPTPTPAEVVPVVMSLAVSATGITVLDSESGTVADLPFTSDGAAAVAALTAALGAPTVSPLSALNCRRESSEYDWGGFKLTFPGVITTAGDGLFSVDVSTSATAGGIQLYGPGNQQVGASLADVSGAVGSEPFDAGFGNTNIEMQAGPGSPGGPDAWGVLGIGTDGALVRMLAPVYINGDC